MEKFTKYYLIFGAVVLCLILFIGFYGEYADWDGERKSEYNRTQNRNSTELNGYKMKCIKECVECHAKVGYPLNKNMKLNLNSKPPLRLSL